MGANCRAEPVCERTWVQPSHHVRLHDGLLRVVPPSSDLPVPVFAGLAPSPVPCDYGKARRLTRYPAKPDEDESGRRRPEGQPKSLATVETGNEFKLAPPRANN
jgi:hypothetical protein